MSLQIEILNSEARTILDQLAKLKLIRITELEDSKVQFSYLLDKLRSNASNNLTLEEITKEVEEVRSGRYKS